MNPQNVLGVRLLLKVKKGVTNNAQIVYVIYSKFVGDRGYGV